MRIWFLGQQQTFLTLSLIDTFDLTACWLHAAGCTIEKAGDLLNKVAGARWCFQRTWLLLVGGSPVRAAGCF